MRVPVPERVGECPGLVGEPGIQAVELRLEPDGLLRIAPGELLPQLDRALEVRGQLGALARQAENW